MPAALAQNLPQILTSCSLLLLLGCGGLYLLFSHPVLIRLVRRDGAALTVVVSSYIVIAALVSMIAGLAVQAALQG